MLYFRYRDTFTTTKTSYHMASALVVCINRTFLLLRSVENCVQEILRKSLRLPFPTKPSSTNWLDVKKKCVCYTSCLLYSYITIWFSCIYVEYFCYVALKEAVFVKWLIIWWRFEFSMPKAFVCTEAMQNHILHLTKYKHVFTST